MGRFGSLSPTLPRRIAFATAVTASSCPTILRCSSSSSRKSLALSSSVSCATGTPVQLDTISAISSSPTSPPEWLLSLRQLSFACLYSSLSLFSLSLKAAARSNSCEFTASSFSASVLAIFSSSSLSSAGAALAVRRTREAASSIKSIALSGKNLSLI